ncbi:hypothetical protein [Chryseobacterium sp. SIMBA_029]|uniref:hypothetical protein n=1 Tax=Chryseobacterium sp. SIMBA_029 TaxID=3085772 RepID=UPI00397E1D75
MKCKLSKLLFFVIFLSQLAFYKAQDKITIQKVEVNGTVYTSLALVPKGVPVTLKVYFNIKKNSSPNEMGNNVKLIAKKLGTNYQVFVRTLGNFPMNNGQSVDYVLSETVNNSSVLIDTSDSGNLYMTYVYGGSFTTVASNLFPMKFIDNPVITNPVNNNTISGSVITDYMTTATTITGSEPVVSSGGYTYYWQRKNPGGNWYNLNSGTINTKNYTPPAAENRYNYQLRRAVQPTTVGLQASYSNEVNVQVRIGENKITENITNNGSSVIRTLVGSTPKGGDNVFTYQWQEYNNPVWTYISNATAIDYTPPANSIGKTFRRIAKTPSALESSSNTITMNDLKIFGNLITVETFDSNKGTIDDQKVMPGQKPVLNRLSTYTSSNLKSGSGQPLSIQWQSKTEAGNWIDIAGGTNEIYTINTPLTQTLQYRRKVTSLYVPDSESNIITVQVSTEPAIENNIISFDPSNVDRIIGTTPAGGDGNYLYIWAADVHPDDSIGEMIYWGASTGGETTMSEYINQLPITSDEYHLTRYAISDGVWNRSNTLIYSVSGGIIQGKKANNNLFATASPAKEVIATVNENNLLFFFKNYTGSTAEIHLVNFLNGRSEKIMNVHIKDDKATTSWTFPTQYLQGIYGYKIIFNDGTLQSGKVIKK